MTGEFVAPISEADGYTPEVKVEIEGGIGWMIYSNPRRRNAVTLNMWKQIPALAASLDANPDVRVVALRGEGDASFVSGADISEFDKVRATPQDVANYDLVSRQASAAIMGISKPTVAVIQRWCVGGGVATALSCDLRFASDNTRFAVPAAKLGLGYRYSGLKALVEIVGPATAREIFYTARQYDAIEAKEIGLINRVAPTASFDDDAKAYLTSIAQNAPLTVKAAKLAIATAMKDPADRDVDAVDEAVELCFASDDYKEGRNAFLEKRLPQFKGR